MKLYVFLHAVCLLHLTLGQNNADGCDEGKGECKILTACPPIARNFNALYMQQRIKFCDDRRTLVCCPKKVKPLPVTETITKIYQRECLAYREKAYTKCEPKDLIVGGKEARPREFPHMALIGTDQNSEEDTGDIENTENTELDSNKKVRWLCGGTLISPKFVISAAHCFFESSETNRVRLGELDYSTEEDDARPQDFRIKNYVSHPDYNFLKNYNDIALAELDGTAQLNSYVVPACLPLSNGTEYNKFIATGWGSIGNGKAVSTHLLKVQVERFDDSECEQIIKLPNKLEHGIHLRTQLCAGSRSDKNDTCSGDSGGPLFVPHPVYSCMYQLVGITSFGIGCGTMGVPGVYVRVNLYTDWIERIVWDAAVAI